MNRQIKAGAVLQYLQIILSIISNLVFTPIALRILGQNQFGLYSFVNSIISYLSLLTMGIGASYVRFYYRCKSGEENASVNQLNGMYMKFFLLMALVCIGLGIYLAYHVDIMLNSSYGEKDIQKAKLMMCMLAINMGASFPFSLFTSFLTSREEFIVLKIVSMITTIFNTIMSVIVLLLGYDSVGIVFSTLIINIIAGLFYVTYSIGKLDFQISWRYKNNALFRKISKFSLFIVMNQVVDQINWQTDKVILAKFVNSEAVAVYAVAANINIIYLSFSGAVSSVFIPKVNQVVVNNAPDCNSKLTDLMIKIGRIQYYIMMLLLIGFIFFGKRFICLWAGSDYEMAYYVTLLLIVPVTVPQIQNIGIEIQRAKNRHQFRSIVYFTMSIINIGLSIFLCKRYGLIGTTVGTAVSLVVANIIIMNIYYHRVLGLNMILFWKNIVSISKMLVLPIIGQVMISALVNSDNIFFYIANIFVYVLLYVISVYLFGMNAEEKYEIKQVIGSFLCCNKNSGC